MLDAIIDLRTPRFLVLIRNAIGGAYASYNNYPTGADLVIALPTTRVAVMGPPGVEFVYKDELRKLRGSLKQRVEQETKALAQAGVKGEKLESEAQAKAASWLAAEEAKLGKRYEKELMNPKEALSLGSVSQIVMPSDLRQVLALNVAKPGGYERLLGDFIGFLERILVGAWLVINLVRDREFHRLFSGEGVPDDRCHLLFRHDD